MVSPGVHRPVPPHPWLCRSVIGESLPWQLENRGTSSLGLESNQKKDFKKHQVKELVKNRFGVMGFIDNKSKDIVSQAQALGILPKYLAVLDSTFFS